VDEDRGSCDCMTVKYGGGASLEACRGGRGGGGGFPDDVIV